LGNNFKLIRKSIGYEGRSKCGSETRYVKLWKMRMNLTTKCRNDERFLECRSALEKQNETGDRDRRTENGVTTKIRE
jgi:hypothetical protein